jgi:hypothetical protein
MTDYVGSITGAMVNSLMKEVKKKSTREKIMKNVIEPMMCDISSKYYSYFIMTTIVLGLMVILLISILILTVVKK